MAVAKVHTTVEETAPTMDEHLVDLKVARMASTMVMLRVETTVRTTADRRVKNWVVAMVGGRAV